MALRGNLKDFSLPDVFQLVTFSKKTGVLRITRADEAAGSVWFRDGEVFFAQSNWHHELLGERLVAAQKITPSALAKVLEIRSGGGEERRLGQILVDEGFITEKVLEAFVQEQIQDTIFDLMRWDEGEFDFELLPEIVDEDIGLSVSIENVIMEGSRRLEEWTRIRKKIPSMEIVFKMATAPGEGTFEISLKPIEWNLLLLVDGTRSVAELARETNRTDFEVARVIYGLFSAGLLEFATDEEVEHLRAERAEREARAAELRAAQAAAEPAPEPEPVAIPEPIAESPAEVPSAPKTEPETAAELEPVSEPEQVAEPEPAREPEVPEFLAEGASGSPSSDDMAVFEQMMGAVLQTPAEETAPEAPPLPEPAVPAEPEPEPEPTPEFLPETPAEGVEVVLEPDILAVPEPEPVVELESEPEPEAPLLTGDLEHDLMSLGLGELSGEDLLAPISAEPEPEPEPELEPQPEPVEPLGVQEPASIEAPELAEEPSDLSSLLDSLGESEPEIGEPAVEPEVIRSESFDDAPADTPSTVISTDAFLDFDGGGLGGGISGGLNDELSALTGVGSRSRPQASVKKIPEEGRPLDLKRDQAVDKDLVLKIIDGIKNL